ncbi:MAG: hypothetical protein Aurels2KO_39110 [Aureliella sp.]
MPVAKMLRSFPSITLSLTLIACFANLAAAQDNAQQARWFKGNLHTHSLWSDGDDFPEVIAAWYEERGYNFLALSDHNILSRGIRWMQLDTIVARADAGILERYRGKFGDAWVETREKDGKQQVRLKPLDEFRCLVEKAGQFIMIQGEEISGSASGAPIHMNVTNVQETILPVNGSTARETMTNNLRQVMEQQEKTGREMLIHLNHPNFHYAVTAEDLGHVVEEQFYEVYNGHPGVNHQGDEDHIGIETMWDVANAIRLHLLASDPILGIATDDSHEYHGKPGSRPGRGWVMVRSKYLTPEHLIKAMKRADFYASSGVVLDDINYDSESKTLDIEIAAADGATYTTEFIATLDDAPSNDALPESIGTVVAKKTGTNVSYTLTGNELYVRARVTSSLAPVDPVWDDQKRQAWTQPVGWTTGENSK